MENEKNLGQPNFITTVIPLANKSPRRILPIDKLLEGEEILPNNFVLIFNPHAPLEEIRDLGNIYQRVVPRISICGRAVILHSNYQGTAVEEFLKKQRKNS